jgi:NAD+ kinase
MFKKALLVYAQPRDNDARVALRKIEHTIKAKKIPLKKILISLLLKEDLATPDLVIILGGDGTVLRAAGLIKKQSVICIRSDTAGADSALTDFSAAETEKLSAILSGKFGTRLRTRLDVSINSHALDEPVLNEAFFGAEEAFALAQYELCYPGAKELQKSSGVLVVTGTGSTAWFSSAGGKAFPADAQAAAFLVREPHTHTSAHATIFRGDATAPDFSLTAKKSRMVLAIDSTQVHHLEEGDTVTFCISKHPLKALCPTE